MTGPELVVSADWSADEQKRWMVRAVRMGPDYVVHPPEPVGDVSTLIGRLAADAGKEGRVLIGVDFPIGFPIQYARGAAIGHFRAHLRQLGHGPWEHFFSISNEPTWQRPFFPLPTSVPGQYRQILASALGARALDELKRRCDRPTRHRGPAECLFFTMGAKQVGAGAIVGWRDLIKPALDDIKLWPFDGRLAELLQSPGTTIAEIYPAEAYTHCGIQIGSGTGRSKLSRANRRAVVGHWLTEGLGEGVVLTAAARSWVEWGFVADDDFDAMVGLVSMLHVVMGRRAADAPGDPAIRQVEGWILGQVEDPSHRVGAQPASLRARGARPDPRLPVPVSRVLGSPGHEPDSASVQVRVTHGVLSQVSRAGLSQAQIAVRGLPPGTVQSPVLVTLRVDDRRYDLVVGDTNACWRSHQGQDTRGYFDELYGKLTKRPHNWIPAHIVGGNIRRS